MRIKERSLLLLLLLLLVQSLERWLCDLRIKLLFLQQTKLNH